MNKVTNDVIYIGVNDHDVDLFEGQYVVPLGMCYNSYVIMDEKIAVMDSVGEFADQWLSNLDSALGGRTPDYLVIQHMEPDHSANIVAFMDKYPNATIVSSMQAFNMMKLYFGTDYPERKQTVKEGDTLTLGKHTLSFVGAPLVHWPEVIMTYDSCDKILFSADGFGKFGALDVEDPEGWACEARRYYFGIVGRFGKQVQAVLKKAATLDIKIICPLHGPVLDDNLEYYIDKYNLWSSYTPEDKGVTIAYTSVYGHTKEAVELLADELKKRGVTAKLHDLARDDVPEAVEDAFRYDKLVLATTTYNGDIFPFMRSFIEDLTERLYQNRTIAMIENGSWAPQAAKVMKKMLEDSKDITYAETTVTIKAALNESSRTAVIALADELAK